MLHYHVLIVGINWLLHKSVIQYAWAHYVGGPVLDIHTVKKEVAKDDVLDALAAAVTAKMGQMYGFQYVPSESEKDSELNIQMVFIFHK